ncbi:hypothetical protein TWF696_007227 [Orbilia brochopaga]|uniref:Uncharacterized protein n=1 Tax=Orbilia brochopaga TaxID=3140254 RepID=A0AAV9UVH8_9PEZI
MDPNDNREPPPPQAPHFHPLIRHPLQPRDRLPELRQMLQNAPEVQKPNVRALIADIEAGVPAAPFYQRGRRVEAWKDLDWTTQFWGSNALALPSPVMSSTVVSRRTVVDA